MAAAVANRPVEQFETQVPMPDWQLTPEEEMFGDTAVDANAMAPLVDENGMPLTAPPTEQGYPQQQPMVRPDGTGEQSQPWLDQIQQQQQQQQLQQQQQRQRQPQPRQPPPQPQDPLAPKPDEPKPRTQPL
jgi:penicillin-binding protein 1A